jgi:hypothetical protein
MTFHTQLVVDVSDVGLARQCFWIHGFALVGPGTAAGPVACEAEAVAEGRAGKYSGPVWPHPERFSMPAARAIALIRIWRLFNMAKL